MQWCLKSLHKQACTSNELGVSKNVSEQSIIFLTLGYNRLKQSGNVDLIQAREDQLINIFNLLDRRITHVITIWETRQAEILAQVLIFWQDLILVKL